MSADAMDHKFKVSDKVRAKSGDDLPVLTISHFVETKGEETAAVCRYDDKDGKTHVVRLKLSDLLLVSPE